MDADELSSPTFASAETDPLLVPSERWRPPEPDRPAAGTAEATGHRVRIRRLPAALAARIAAGETIERPASVVKELLENALDAGATTIRVDIQGGGLGLIRVGDDGVGIRAAELWLACERHATSKLLVDPGGGLDQVRTLGFRGEALPSIAAVAELSLVSATEESGVGWRLTLREGQVVTDEPAPRARGTTVSVRHLFQQMPARLAAVARPHAEIGQIGQVARRMALTAPGVNLALVVDGRVVVQTTGSGELTTTLTEVYGAGVAGRLLPLGPIAVAGARVRGVVAAPEVTRPGRDHVHFIVNGRWVQPRGLQQALETAYRPVLPRGRHPVLALVIEVAPDRIDVNIHPAKLDVRLRAEREIGIAAGDVVRHALGRHPVAPRTPIVTGVAALARDAAILEETVDYDDQGVIVTPGLPPLRLVGQVRSRLLLLEGERGLYLIDQHRAHERILYERLAAEHGAAAGRPEPVALPEPLLLEPSPAQVARFSRRLADLAALGFDCEEFGGRTFLLRAAPRLPGVVAGAETEALAGLGEPAAFAGALLTLGDEDAGEGEGWRERLLVQLSCRTALRRGKALDRAAMRALVHGLGQTGAPAVCPHGSPLLMHLSGDLLGREFGW